MALNMLAKGNFVRKRLDSQRAIAHDSVSL